MSRQDISQVQCYVQAAIKHLGLATPSWRLPNQFGRAGQQLDPAEREALLVRSYYVLRGLGQSRFCPGRLNFLAEYWKEQTGGSAVESIKHAYPWYELEEEMRREQRSLLLFGFGSLINPESASYHLSRRMGPAVAFGLRRVFNYCDHGLANNPLGQPGECYVHEQAKLNAALSPRFGEMINGVLYCVDADDLSRLRPREKGYDLERLQVMDYIDVVDPRCCAPRLTAAYLLRTTKEEQTSSLYLPHVSYLNVCAEGLKPYGGEFTQLFLETTYLSDGITTLERWLQQQLAELAQYSPLAAGVVYGQPNASEI